MKVKYLYTIPLIWFTLGIMYTRSIPKNGFSGVGEVFIVLLVGILLLFGVLAYHVMTVIKKRETSSHEK